MTEQRITPFLFEGEAMVRVIEREGAPWFWAADPCGICGIKNVRDAVSRLADDEKGVALADTLGGKQEVLIVSEGGFYTLVMRSRDALKPGSVAYRLRRFVTNDVLPAIRQTGRYELPAPRPVPATLEQKPFWEWTLEEVRTHLSVATGYRLTLNTASAAWYLMAAGFPRPPRKLMPAWWQGDMALREPAPPGSVTITVPMGGQGSAH